MTLYVKYSSKPPYLPEAVAESKKELARMLGITVGCVASSFSHGRSTYQIVEVEDEGAVRTISKKEKADI